METLPPLLYNAPPKVAEITGEGASRNIRDPTQEIHRAARLNGAVTGEVSAMQFKGGVLTKHSTAPGAAACGIVLNGARQDGDISTFAVQGTAESS